MYKYMNSSLMFVAVFCGNVLNTKRIMKFLELKWPVAMVTTCLFRLFWEILAHFPTEVGCDKYSALS